MKIINLALPICIVTLMGSSAFAAMPTGMTVNIVNTTNKPIEVKWTEKSGSTISNTDFKTMTINPSLGKKFRLVNELFPIEVKGAHEREIGYNSKEGKIQVKVKTNKREGSEPSNISYQLELLEELPAKAYGEYTIII